MKRKRSGNQCTTCGHHDRWLGEVFESSNVPSDVPRNELLDFEAVMRLYGQLPSQQSGRGPKVVLRLPRNYNVIKDIHEDGVPCLFCAQCGQVTLIQDASRVHIVS